MNIKIEKLNQDELEKRGVFSWPMWEKEISRFDWHYDGIEECYFLEGEVEIEIKGEKTVKIGKGDFVTFPEGLSCTWIVKKPVLKHYNFK